MFFLLLFCTLRWIHSNHSAPFSPRIPYDEEIFVSTTSRYRVHTYTHTLSVRYWLRWNAKCGRAQVFHWLSLSSSASASPSSHHWIWARREEITSRRRKEDRHDAHIITRRHTLDAHTHTCSLGVSVCVCVCRCARVRVWILSIYSEQIVRKCYLIFDRFRHDDHCSGSYFIVYADGNAGFVFYWLILVLLVSKWGENKRWRLTSLYSVWVRHVMAFSYKIRAKLRMVDMYNEIWGGNQMENRNYADATASFTVRTQLDSVEMGEPK